MKDNVREIRVCPICGKTYGEAPADDGVMYETFAGTEDQSVLGGSLSFSIDYAQYGDIGSYTITPSGLTSDSA